MTGPEELKPGAGSGTPVSGGGAPREAGPPAPGAPPWVRLGPRLLFASLVLWGLLYTWQLRDHKLLPLDEGTATVIPWRILEGQVPYGDFVEAILPFSFLPTALAFEIFGVSLASERGLAFLLGVLMALGVDFGLRRLRAPLALRALALAVQIPFGVSYWPIASHHWWATGLQVWAAALLLPGDRPAGIPRAALSGALAALAFFSLQDQGAYFAAALLLLHLLPAARRAGGGRADLLSWCAGAAASSLPVLAWLFSRVPIRLLWEYCVLFPLAGYNRLSGHQFRLLAGFREAWGLWASGGWHRDALYTTSLALAALGLFLLPLLAFLSLAWARRKAPRRDGLGVLWALALAGFGTAMHRWALTSVVWVAPQLAFALAAGLAPVSRALAGRAASALRWGTALAACVFLVFSARFLAISGGASAVTTPRGTLRSLARADAAAFQAAVDAIGREVPPGAPMACVGGDTLILFATAHPNPTRHNVLILPDYPSPALVAEAAGDLAEKPVPWICAGTPRTPWEEVNLGRFLGGRYRPVFRNWKYSLYRLGPEPPPPESRPSP